MKKFPFLLLMPLLLTACEWNIPALELESLYLTPQIIYTDNNLTGRGGAVLFNNEIHYLITHSAKQDAVPGYPDKGVYFHKLKLVSENNPLVAELETNPVTDPINITDLVLTPDKKHLAIVYRSATGMSYGFRMPYTLWDGQKLTSSTVFSNQNFGLYPRIGYRPNNTPVVISFSAAGYFLVNHTPSLGEWNWQQASNFGEWLSDFQIASANDKLYVGMLVTNVTPSHLRVMTISPDNSTQVLESGNPIANFCDIAFINGNYQVLIVKEDKLLLGGNNFYEIITTQPNINSLATILYDGATPTVAFQTPKLVQVLRKLAGEWKVIFSFNLNMSESKTSCPSLVMKNTRMYLVFNDDTNVYLAKL